MRIKTLLSIFATFLSSLGGSESLRIEKNFVGGDGAIRFETVAGPPATRAIWNSPTSIKTGSSSAS